MAEREGDWKEVWRGSGLDAKIGGLAADTQYSFRVAAMNAAGVGPGGEPATCSTLLLPPSPPQRVTLEASEG